MREQGNHEAEGSRRVAMGLRRDLVQRAERQTALRQMPVERREPEGQGARRCADAFHPRQPAAQLVHDRGAAGAVRTMNGDGEGRHR